MPASFPMSRGAAALVLLAALAAPTDLLAQAAAPAAPRPAAAPPRPAAAPRPGEVATDPIRCWWRTDRPAIRVGERFIVTLTCGVIETSRITVVPNVTQLDPGAVGLTPYEVVTGRRHEDLIAPPWRYVQFEYEARLLGDGCFGQDVNSPALTVTYNVQQGSEGPQGRDQRYVLPALPMRVESLVPRSAADIRDSSRDSFASTGAHRFRATAVFVAASIAFAFAALLVLFGVVQALGGIRRRASLRSRPVPTLAVLSASLSRLQQVRTDARGGWTPALARRALALLRIGGAVAGGRPLAQKFVARGTAEREGQLLVRTGLLRPRYAMLSGAATPLALAHRLENGAAPSGPARLSVQELQDALQALNAAAYARNGTIDDTGVDSAVEQGTRAIRRLRSAHRWPMSAMTRLTGPEPASGKPFTLGGR